MTKADTSHSTPATAAAILTSPESHVVRQFRKWLAAQQHAEERGICDDERERRTDAMIEIEGLLRSTMPQSPCDLAIKTLVAIGALDVFVMLGVPVDRWPEGASAWATCIVSHICQQFPEIMAIIADYPTPYIELFGARLWGDDLSPAALEAAECFTYQ